MPKRPDFSRPLPRSLVIPKLMTLRTLADVRTLLRHLPAATRAKSTWQHVADELTKAAAGDDPRDVYIALQMVFELERIPWRIK
jgi:hypothetical protein